MQKRGILERLDADEVVIGDGGFLYCMERRGYVKAGPWTPEATVEHHKPVSEITTNDCIYFLNLTASRGTGIGP